MSESWDVVGVEGSQGTASHAGGGVTSVCYRTIASYLGNLVSCIETMSGPGDLGFGLQ